MLESLILLCIFTYVLSCFKITTVHLYKGDTSTKTTTASITVPQLYDWSNLKASANPPDLVESQPRVVDSGAPDLAPGLYLRKRDLGDTKPVEPQKVYKKSKRNKTIQAYYV